MCTFCEEGEVIQREPSIFSHIGTKFSLRIDEESRFLKLRVEIGSAGYTLPIAAHYCMFCGKPLVEGVHDEST